MRLPNCKQGSSLRCCCCFLFSRLFFTRYSMRYFVVSIYVADAPMCVCCERESTYKWFRLNGNCFDIIDQFFTLAFSVFGCFLCHHIESILRMTWFSDSNRALCGFSMWKIPFFSFFPLHLQKYMYIAI